MSRAFMPSQHYDDFTLSSTGENNDDYQDQHAIHEENFPLKSTLPSQYRKSQTRAAQRPPFPRQWTDPNDIGPQVLQRDFARNSGAEDDVTLSTDVGTAIDEYLGPSPDRRRTTTLYEDDSYIPGVGRGHQRTGGNGASSYSAHRDLLATSNLPIHPSPVTAARHEQLRRSSARNQAQRPSPLSSSSASDGEDSESGVESSSTSTTSFVMHPKGLMQSKAESTGNHYAYTASQADQSPVMNRHERPKLDSRALDEMDKAVKKGRAALRQNVPHSPSPDPSRRTMPRGSGVVRSRKEERDILSRRDRDAAEGSNGSSGGDARKPSDGSSNGRKQAGTAGSTTGDTLVEEDNRDYLRTAASALHPGERSPFIKLPSGQKMGRGVYPDSAVFLPDITGMTSALESPAKAILGVEHRDIRPEVIHAAHLQTNEARFDEFNDLAHYVKSVEKNLDQTQKKVKAVEQTSLKCAEEVDELREEWSSWRQVKGKKTTLQDEESVAEEEEDDYEGKVKAINEHIAQLTHDLQSYRSTMERMRMEKTEREQAYQRKIKEKQHRQAERRRVAALSHAAGPMSSSPIKPNRIDEEDEATRLEMVALRRQVNKVAKEVERLRDIVDGDGVDFKAPSAAKSARFAASVPAPVVRRDVGVGSQSPFIRPNMGAMRSSSLQKEYGHARQSSEFDDMQGRNSSPPPSVRGFNEDLEGDLSDDDEGDVTARPVELHDSIHEEGEADVSVVAQSRAEKTYEVIEDRGTHHDERTCTVCMSKARNDKRRQVRRDKVNKQANLSYNDAEDEDTRTLLSLLDAAAANQDSFNIPRSITKHQSIILRLLKEHMDEFYHHRMLYCELADELKQITPDMTRVKRKILAEHVMEAVEGLEFRARRINLLQGLTSSQHTADTRKNKDKKQRQRNLAPSVDGGDLYRRVVSA